MDHSKNHHLGLNKISRAIRKSPLHQPSYRPTVPPQPQPPPTLPQPQVYNISKNDFRSIVQQLTGTPSRDSAAEGYSPLPPPPQPRPPKAASMRLQRIRPPPLTPIARPPPPRYQNPKPNPNFFTRPNPVAQSPVSAYMKYLESSLLYSDGRSPVPSPGLLPPPLQFQNPNHNQSPNPHPGLLPSPAPPSPSAYLNLFSPKSPYPLLSPGFRYPPPLTPNFSFSPLSPGILGPGPGSHPPPPSPGLLFPPSPLGFFPMLSPRWGDM